MRTPVVLITGVDPEAMAVAMVSLQFDLPNAVAVRHRVRHLDGGGTALRRTVSDVSGVVEKHELELGHACVPCAIREDVLPTLERLASDGRWASIVAHLPFGASGEQVCSALATEPRLARRLRVAAVVAAVAGPTLTDDLLGDDLLRERGLHVGEHDVRGVGEVGCGLVEAADVIALHDRADAAALSLVADLARPDAVLVPATAQLDGAALLAGGHDHARARAWTDPARTLDLPSGPAASWRVELRSSRAVHPARLLDRLEALAGGRHRSRGCLWLPSRPGEVVQWDGAGGQLSVGTAGPWGRREPMTRIVVHGTGTAPAHLESVFEDVLVRDDERGPWDDADGLEPWLGPIREVA